MRLIVSIITCAFLLQEPCDDIRPNMWQCIIPLKSTRADVQKLLGDTIRPNQSVYETKDALVHIVYSSSPCEEGIAGRWNVPPDTVIRIEVKPKKDIYMKDEHVVGSKYKKVEDVHVGGLVSYINDEEGILIKSQYERIVATYYGPTANERHLICPTHSQ